MARPPGLWLTPQGPTHITPSMLGLRGPDHDWIIRTVWGSGDRPGPWTLVTGIFLGGGEQDKVSLVPDHCQKRVSSLPVRHQDQPAPPPCAENPASKIKGHMLTEAHDSSLCELSWPHITSSDPEWPSPRPGVSGLARHSETHRS